MPCAAAKSTPRRPHVRVAGHDDVDKYPGTLAIASWTSMMAGTLAT
jgi:hypothetical protein